MSQNTALRVLAVDDDRASLKILSCQLEKCGYKVTSTTAATEALDMLRQNKDDYDIVVTDVMMPDMDGFKLLENIRFDIDIPVIMITVDSDVKKVVKGIRSGAQDYFLKPVQLDDLRSIGDYVVKKLESPEKSQDDTDVAKDYEAESNQENDGSRKKYKKSNERIIWKPDMHRKFLNVVELLEARDNTKIVPSKILEIMNEPGLTRENVASHLQKFRLTRKQEADEEADNILIRSATSKRQYEHTRMNSSTRIFANNGILSPYHANTFNFRNPQNIPLIPQSNSGNISYLGYPQQYPNPGLIATHPSQHGLPVAEIAPYEQLPNAFASNYQMHKGNLSQMVFHPQINSPLQLAQFSLPEHTGVKKLHVAGKEKMMFTSTNVERTW